MPLMKKKVPSRRPRRTTRFKKGMAYRPRAMVRYNKAPSFVETIQMYRIPSQAGYNFKFLGSSINQMTQYQQLYRQFRINRLTWLFVPDWNSFDVNAGAGAINAPRIVYAIDDTAGATLPTSEADVLEDNGCKIRALTRPLKISHVPVPELGQAVSTGGFASVNKKFQWLNTDGTGLAVPHGCIRAWISNGGQPIMFTVYCKVSFSLKDPQ